MNRSVEEIIAAALKQKEYQTTYRTSERGKLRQQAYNTLHNYENKVGLWMAAGQLPNGTPFSTDDGIAAITLAREEYERKFAKLPRNTPKS